jgi:hypothetical protein
MDSGSTPVLRSEPMWPRSSKSVSVSSIALEVQITPNERKNMKVRSKLYISLKLKTLTLVALVAIIAGAFGFSAGPVASVDLNFHASLKNNFQRGA